MEMMLFRDWLPMTSNLIAGMAQAGFYENLLFHRIIDLGNGQGSFGYIFQGGDPLGTGFGGPGMVGNDPLTAWKFQNEFAVATIFSGRGQLAMANAGTRVSTSVGSGGSVLVPDYRDTNGSQFFITDGQPRHVDFKHNVFGQMIRGWELLPLLKATKTTNTRPDQDVTITSADVVVDETDAVLVLSAKAAGSAVITVTATDPVGEKDTKEVVVTAVPDTRNDAPFLRRNPTFTTAKDTPLAFPLDAVDLEFDYVSLQHSVLPISTTVGANGSLLVSSGRVVQLQPFVGYAGPINLGFNVRQFNIGTGAYNSVADYTNAYVAVGDQPGRGEGVDIDAFPGVALNNVVVGKMQDLDSSGAPQDFTAQINWGDGTPLTMALLQRDSSALRGNRYLALGSHTYARVGIYPVVVDFVGNRAARAQAVSTAVVTSGAVRAHGENIQTSTGRLVKRMLATFSDTAAALPSAYSATVDWGDGVISSGVISRDPETGTFIVRGAHGYRDPEPYSVRVRIHKMGDPADNDCFAWTRIDAQFNATPHLPPFPHPKLTIAWNSGPLKSHQGTPGPDYKVTYSGAFIVINTGNRTLKSGKLRFWLSPDRVLSTTDPDKDLQLIVNGKRELSLTHFVAGASGSGIFTIELPKGESTARKYLLSEAVYDDPIANDDGTVKVIATGPLPPAIVVVADPNLQTTESGGTASFKVVLDSPPETAKTLISSIVPGNPVTITTSTPHGLANNAEVLISAVTAGTPSINGIFNVTLINGSTFTIPVDVSVAGSGGAVQANPKVTIPLESTLITEGTVSPAQLIFDSSNWSLPQTVTATGVDDLIKDGDKTYSISLKAAQSPDALYSGRVGGSVQIVNKDNE